ncbi:MAG: DUF3560 domain-containing protein [Gammaproteobacteria bacterium]|nr:DUF3560 domain-containing protein [Gammaproteobacteria bacterium]
METNGITFTATYSPEDNKLRLYASARLDEELYAQVKKAGFSWAPKQGLFVAPSWSPSREDLCIALAGEIDREEMTLAERAEIKALRLDGYRENRLKDAGIFAQAAQRISERFAGGQPILVGHHSERRARKDKERMESAERKSIKAVKTANYWAYRAEGVQQHANYKNDSGVRARRIKTLLADLRDWQRRLNHHGVCIMLWTKIEKMDDLEKRNKAIEHYAGAYDKNGSYAPSETRSKLNSGEMNHDEALEKTLSHHRYFSTSPHTGRWINHILNRLSYERAELGEVQRYEGEIKATTLQAFAREHGAHKPKATQQGEKWNLSSSVDLPYHIGEGKALCLSLDQWRDLMKNVGYEVPTPKPRRKSTKKVLPLINPTAEEAERLQRLWQQTANATYAHLYPRGMKQSTITKMSQREYSLNSKGDYSQSKTIEIDINGVMVWATYKGPTSEAVCRIRVFTAGKDIYGPYSIIHLEDKRTTVLPIQWAQPAQKEAV